jgi:hypothetical protein
MKNTSIFGATFALLFVTFGATAGTVPLITLNYNFTLAGGGGGSTATLNGVPVEIFCDDFDNDIYVPSHNTAYVTTLGTGANLSETRFGDVAATGWTPMTTLGTQDDAFFNSGIGSSALVRYAMVADLMSQYNLSQGNSTSNNQLQEAIWTIMDPTAEGAVINPASVDPSSDLEQAATWYSNISTNPAALNNFLSQFEVISPSNMTFTNGLGMGGFQEQIVMTVAPTPEPRGTAAILLSLLVGAFVVMRRGRLTGKIPAAQV